jgi:hypothetical protein
MPGIPSSAYGTAEGVLTLARSIINDARIPGGDVLLDGAVFTFPYLNAAYADVQYDLENAGAEGFTQTAWLLGIPQIPVTDPGARVLINDGGTQIAYPNQGTTNEPIEMRQPKNGLPAINQGSSLGLWEWRTDSIVLLGANVWIDALLRYHRQLPALNLPTDSVPIRGVQNAVAFYVAALFAGARGSPVAQALEQQGDHALDQFTRRLTRRKQFTSHRRRPYSLRARRGPRSF